MLKKLDEMYDRMFNDPLMIKLLSNFHSRKWNKLDVKRKIKLFEEINKRVAEIYEIETPKLSIEDVNSNNYGSFLDFNYAVFLNKNVLINNNGYENIDTYFHELRHSLQARSVQNKLSKYESVDKKLIKEWATNFMPDNYFGADSPYYIFQSCEEDAWSVGLLSAREVYKICKKTYGEDVKFQEYAASHIHEVGFLLSDGKTYRDYVKECKEAINEIYKDTLPDLDMMIKSVSYIKNLFSIEKKSVKDLSFNQIAGLLSPCAFTNLYVDKRVEVLNRYCELIGASKYVTIKERNVGSIYINDAAVSLKANSIFILNCILTDAFKGIVEDELSKDKSDYFNEHEFEELKLNMYVDRNGNRINFVEDGSVMFLFDHQPYARYESRYMLGSFDRIKKIEKTIYGKNYSGWEKEISLYDMDLVDKLCRIYLDESYEQHYANLLKEYKEKIELDKRKKGKR